MIETDGMLMNDDKTKKTAINFSMTSHHALSSPPSEGRSNDRSLGAMRGDRFWRAFFFFANAPQPPVDWFRGLSKNAVDPSCHETTWK